MFLQRLFEQFLVKAAIVSVGWDISNLLYAENSLKVLRNAISDHGKPEIVNSDQGSQLYIAGIKLALSWSVRTKFKKKYINPLLETGLLEMSHPDLPSSPLQRYFLSNKGTIFLDQLSDELSFE